MHIITFKRIGSTDFLQTSSIDINDREPFISTIMDNTMPFDGQNAGQKYVKCTSVNPFDVSIIAILEE